MSRILRGAPVTTHGLKEYGYGKSMVAGLERLTRESRQAGQREGFQQGIQDALQRMSVLERLVGRQFRTR